ncbi:MAG: sulfatase [Planctomycetaceae bacterium]|nr:sulfatase [Planctomycetaceae bacterium]
MPVPPYCWSVLSAIIAVIVAFPDAARAERLNVLLVTADDLGITLGCYGDHTIPTPQLDALAASGVQFNNAWIAQASCSPSRSAMLTGLYPHTNGQYGLTNSGDFRMHAGMIERSMPTLLKQAGYRTAIAGKLHVGPEDEWTFDERIKISGGARDMQGVAAAAQKFLDAQNEPFFLMVNYSDPHVDRSPDTGQQGYFLQRVDGLPETLLTGKDVSPFPFQRIDHPQELERIAGYYNCVVRLDTGIGLLMQTLAATGHDDDTLVIFLGDHGPPFCRGKTTCYEGGLKVPFLVRWPGVTTPRLSEQLVSSVDIAPTILDAADVDSPATFHGRSLRPILANDNATWREYLGADFHFHGERNYFPRRALRDSRYKLIRNLIAGDRKAYVTVDADRAYQHSRDEKYAGTDVRETFDRALDPPEYELYDLQNDPWEFHNLASDSAHADTLKRMQSALLEWQSDTNDPFRTRQNLAPLQSRAKGEVKPDGN